MNDPDNIELLIPELNEKYGGDFVDSLDHNELKVLAAHMLVEEAVKYCSDHADIEGLTDALIHRIERYEDFEMGDIPGDCDDYVKDKIALAVNAGVPPEKLGFLVVDVNGPDEEGGGHAVLAMENDGEIIIFDNAGQPMTLDDYKDLYPNMEIKFFVSAAPGTEPLIHEDARYAHSLANRYNDLEPTPKDELFPRDPDSADTATAQVSAGPVP